MAIQDQFQQILGRTPTAAEVEYLSKFITEGSLQEHEIGQILQASPEYQQTRLEKDTTAYGQKLQASDDQVLARGADVAGAQATSRFAGLGRPNSSALAASVYGQTGQLAGDLASRRQSALADFYGQGLKQNAALYKQGGQSALERGYGLRDETRQFGQQMQLAKYQQDNFNSYLDQANRNQKRSALGGAIGAGIGGIAGSYGGPAGAMAGASIGSKFGSGLF